jgi:hypothetical protein
MSMGSNESASLSKRFFWLRRRAKVAALTRRTRATTPTRANTTPERTLFCKKDLGCVSATAVELATSLLVAIVGIWVTVTKLLGVIVMVSWTLELEVGDAVESGVDVVEVVEAVEESDVELDVIVVVALVVAEDVGNDSVDELVAVVCRGGNRLDKGSKKPRRLPRTACEKWASIKAPKPIKNR